MRLCPSIPFLRTPAARKAPLHSSMCSVWRRIDSSYGRGGVLQARFYSELPSTEASVDGRARLSKLWVPTGGIAASSNEDFHAKLLRAGYIRQAHSGIFHMLPLGRRVQDKLEALIDKYMFQLGASKLALSSISSEELWAKSGRLDKAGSELFRFQDRKDSRYLLSPTHEEEITSLVSNTVKSYKDLPIRLYQISRKYRDERRPRQGLLRSREFIMKDLYTFDYSPSLALATYHQVREAYSRLFDELKLPYLIADADSGDIGGNLSHEFHFPTSKGEDNVISCSSCGYVANEELAESSPLEATTPVENPDISQLRVWRGISYDRQILINVWYLSQASSDQVDASSNTGANELNLHIIKSILPEFDTSVEDPLPFWEKIPSRPSSSHDGEPLPRRLINLVDGRVDDEVRSRIEACDTYLPLLPPQPVESPETVRSEVVWLHPTTGEPVNLLRINDGDRCPRCPDGTLKVQKAIELGHTFYLGTRYSKPLNASVSIPTEIIAKEEIDVEFTPQTISPPNQQVSMQMGCHGIGVSRIIGAVADTLADEKGLNWPRVMAPFEVVVVPAKNMDEQALKVYDTLANTAVASGQARLDLILDDRQQSFPWKMADADLVGYPVIVVVGRRWNAEKILEVQCRRQKVRAEVHINDLQNFVQSILEKL